MASIFSAIEDELPIRRKRRRLIQTTGRQELNIATLRIHQSNSVTAIAPMHHGNLAAIGREDTPRVVRPFIGQAPRLTALRRDHIELWLATAIRRQDQRMPIGGPVGLGFNRVILCHAAQRARDDLENINIGTAVLR